MPKRTWTQQSRTYHLFLVMYRIKLRSADAVAMPIWLPKPTQCQLQALKGRGQPSPCPATYAAAMLKGFYMFINDSKKFVPFVSFANHQKGGHLVAFKGRR